MKNKDYKIRIAQRRMKGLIEYTSAEFAAGASIIIGLLILLMGTDFKSVNLYNIIFSVIWFVEGIFCFVIKKIIENGIKKNRGISKGVRLTGVVLIMTFLTGNIFTTVAGFNLIKKTKTVEYYLSYYSILTSIAIIAISATNLFKEYVADTFILGMGLLLLLTIFYLLIFIYLFFNSTRTNLFTAVLSVPLILSILIGNIFSFLLGMIFLSKYLHRNDEMSIEWIDIVSRLFRNYMAVLGIFVVGLLLSLSICSRLTFDYSLAIDNNYSAILLSPSKEYLFGTDDYGRCVFTRIVFGARISLIVGMLATITPIIFGGVLGAFAGYYGGSWDNIIMRVLDILYAVPGILLAIAIVAVFGANTVNLILALSIGSIPDYARTIRATVMSVSKNEFVEAARACGANDGIIIFKHIIPNSLAPIIVRATIGIGSAVLSTSALSYLGLGVEPHIPEWGNILKVGSNYLETNPYLAVFPGLAIILIVLAFNYFGDGLRDALDPKLK